MIDRRFFLAAAAGALAVEIRPYSAAAQPAWPNRPLHFIVGFSAGSTPDLIARTIAEPLSPLIGQPVVVDNKPGASGNIAADMVAKARDDHTVGVMININLTIARLLNPALAFDPRRDLAPICLVGTGPLVLALSPRLAKEKAGIDQLRATGTKLNYGSVGIGSMAHLGMEILSAKVGMTPTHVPYPGNPQVLAALASNEIDLALVPAGLAMPQVRAGTIGALAVASPRRSSLAPDVPTLAELGVPDTEIEVWVAVAVAATMPEAYRQKLEQLVLQVVRSPEVSQKLNQQGWDVVAMPADAFAHRLEEETKALAAVIEKQNIRAN